MNILPQILNFETNNFLNNSFILQIRNTFKEFVESIFTDFSDNKYISSMLSLQKNFNVTIKNLIINLISSVDEIYKYSLERKYNYYINKSNVPRTIYTIYGEITFYRTLYIHKDNKEYFFLYRQSFRY